MEPPHVPPEGLENQQDLSKVKSVRLTPLLGEAGSDVCHFLSLLSSFSVAVSQLRVSGSLPH